MTHQPATRWTDPLNGDCPVQTTLETLGGRHGATILHCLLEGEMHFLELSRAIRGISRKVLTERLKKFQTQGLIERTEKDDALGRVGYSLTPKGQALGQIIDQLHGWTQASWTPEGTPAE